jgi:hypothetical protein
MTLCMLGAAEPRRALAVDPTHTGRSTAASFCAAIPVDAAGGDFLRVMVYWLCRPLPQPTR